MREWLKTPNRGRKDQYSTYLGSRSSIGFRGLLGWSFDLVNLPSVTPIISPVTQVTKSKSRDPPSRDIAMTLLPGSGLT